MGTCVERITINNHYYKLIKASFILDEIVNELHRLKLPGMADCWTSLCETHRIDKLSLSDGLQLLLQNERDMRLTNRVTRLIKEAGFSYPASIEELELDTQRGVDGATVSQLGTCNFVRDGNTVLIFGPSGTGKTYLATALGDRACRLGYHVFYFNMQKLLERIRLERLQGHEVRFFEKIAHTDLLILDDFGMKVLQGQQQNDFEQLVDDRYRKKALIIASQLPVADWYPVIGNELIAEAVLDRIVHKAIRFQLKGESLRKKY
jgi:DNA replication protein DnaC